MSVVTSYADGHREFRYLLLVSGVFVATLLIANTTAQKLIAIGPALFPAGIVVFPLSYIFGDVLTEVYGYRRARRVIWTGFIAEVLMAVMYTIVIMMPPAPVWPNQQALVMTLGQTPRIVGASIIAYFAGEFTNSIVLAKMKVRMNGKHLWARTIGSTIVGQGVDTIVFVSAAFLGVWPTSVVVQATIAFYLFKVAYEALATPITYAIVGWLKRAEGVDTYDADTKFSPFEWVV